MINLEKEKENRQKALAYIKRNIHRLTTKELQAVIEKIDEILDW